MFIRDTWYMAAFAQEISEKPFARTLLGERVVFYRTAGGAPAALFDRCPHRFAPLAIGKVQGDNLTCGYHGLTFGPDGGCVHNPHGDGVITRNMRVKSYPVAERDGAVWIWMGDPARADESLIRGYPFMREPGFTTVSGYMHVEANYLLINDNLLDLSHAQFVHPMFQVSTGSRRKPKFEAGGQEDSIWSKMLFCDTPPNPFAAMFTDEQVVDNWIDTFWHPPAVTLLDIGTTAAGLPRGPAAARTPGIHILTPETEQTTHYFWFLSRNVLLADNDLSERMRTMTDDAFRYEDKPIIEMQQRETGNRDIMDLGPLLLQTDAAPVRARRIVKRLMETESARGENA